MKKKKWLRKELLIVYYLAKWGSYGALHKFTRNELIILLDHSKNSYEYAFSKFRFLLGLDYKEEFPGHNPTVAQKEIVKELENKTISQVRDIIAEAWKSSDTSIPKEKDSGLEDGEGGQFSIDFP